MRFSITALMACWAIPLVQAENHFTRPAISQEISPIRRVELVSRTGHASFALVRKPPGKGPFPAIIYFHGTLGPWRIAQLTAAIETGQTLSRFLAAGYVTVANEFAPRGADPQTKEALWDCLAAVEMMKKAPEVDPRSVVVYGTSGGGSLALEVAGETSVSAAIADEPASILFTGLLTKDVAPGREVTSRDGMDMMEHPEKYYNAEARKFTRAKVGKISCPLLIVRGDMQAVNHFNEEVLLPELKSMGKSVKQIEYPGQKHAFTISERMPDALLKFFNDCQEFLKPLLRTKPAPVEASLVQTVLVGK